MTPTQRLQVELSNKMTKLQGREGSSLDCVRLTEVQS